MNDEYGVKDEPKTEGTQVIVKSTGVSEEQGKHSRKFNVVRMEKRISATFSILAKLFTISTILVASIFIFRELKDDSYAINQINVPAAFENAGLSGVVVANLISDRLTEIFELLRTQEDALQYIKASDRVDVEVDMVGIGVPVRSFIALIGQSLGISSRKKISGDVFVTDKKAILILRVTGRMATQFEVDIFEQDMKAVCLELVDKASTHILKYTEPIALELYYSNVKHDGSNTIKMAQYLMDNFSDDEEMVRHAYDSWTWGLIYSEKLDEAEKKLVEGIAKFPKEERLYNAWGSVYAGQGKDELAIEKYRMVLKLIKKGDRQKKRISTVYSNMGISYAYLGQLDSAMYYFKQALEIDKDDWILHYNVGGLYLLKNDTTQFFSQLEIALEDGADVEMIRKDEDLKSMMTNQRVVELLKKYTDY